MPLIETKRSGNKWSGPLAEEHLVNGQEPKGLGWHAPFSQEWGVTSGTPTVSLLCNVLTNHLKREMKNEMTNGCINSFDMKNPVPCSLVLQKAS